VEVNASFYRFPTQAMVEAWNRRLPKGFHLVVKGHREITHRRRLADCEEPLGAFLERVLPLRALRVVLWQLPPSLRCDPPRLDAFLTVLGTLGRRRERSPGRLRHAVEFRHESWWEGEQVREVLSRHRAAMVAVSHPRLPAAVLPTGNWFYLRFHGLGRRLYDYDYSDDELREWVARLEPHRRGRTVYAFFNNDWHANAPRNAARFRELLS
jgi:uncharacterized protein YecE (DUF72 family)